MNLGRLAALFLFAIAILSVPCQRANAMAAPATAFIVTVAPQAVAEATWAGINGTVGKQFSGKAHPTGAALDAGAVAGGEVAGEATVDVAAQTAARQAALDATARQTALNAAKTVARLALLAKLAADKANFEAKAKGAAKAGGASCAASGSPQGPKKEPNKGNLWKVGSNARANEIARELGYEDAEQIEEWNDFYPSSKFDIYLNGNDVYVMGKGGTGLPQWIGKLGG